jgi:23S rRNA (uracil1939-C5)-methyltransferase
MALRVGDRVELTIEKPAGGGRMIARHNGQIVLVAGAIPGERVSAHVTRAEKQVAFADPTAVLEPSPDRRAPAGDTTCGGCLYAHIAYPRQLDLKAELLRDAFARLGRIAVADAVPIASGAENGYRMRARFHVKDGRGWFYRENSHDICDPRQTRQVTDAAVNTVDAAIQIFASRGAAAESVELAENVAANQRAIHVTATTPAALGRAIDAAVAETGLTGASAVGAGNFVSAGDPIVTDPLAALSDGRIQTGVLRRHPQSFFQSNRFLIGTLVNAVLSVVGEGRVLDLYAGVGLFSVALAASGHDDIIAVEGNPRSAADLERNAAPYTPAMRVIRDSVEKFLHHRGTGGAKTLIVDPPRTGLSKQAAESIVSSRVPRIVYVSCDAATMARDARRLLDAGYALASLQGFDLFPNTPLVESLGVFELAGGQP